MNTEEISKRLENDMARAYQARSVVHLIGETANNKGTEEIWVNICTASTMLEDMLIEMAESLGHAQAGVEQISRPAEQEGESG